MDDSCVILPSGLCITHEVVHEVVSRPDPSEDRVGQFRSDASDTQLGAAMQVMPRTGTQRRLVLDEITSSGGACDFEIEERLGMLHQTASARRRELVQSGWVEDSGRRRVNPETDARAIVWVRVP